MTGSRKTISKPSPQSVFVALLRGINVGGKNKLPMKELVVMFEREGCTKVRNYIQSGNVVFEAAPSVVTALPGRLEKAISRRFAYDVPILVRSAAELATVVGTNPFVRPGVDPKRLHVAFLADSPAKSHVSSLDGARSPGDEFTLLGREIYLHLPNGAGKSKFTNAYFDSKLKTTSTIRNWATVNRLLQMTAE